METGFINNITFENINCICENGSLPCDEQAQNISNVYFLNITVGLNKHSDQPKGSWNLHLYTDNGLTEGIVH